MSAEKSGNKRKYSGNDRKPHFYKRQHKNVLVTGQRGFLVTSNFREKECAQDCLKLLNSYADKLYGNTDDDEKNTEKDIEVPPEKDDNDRDDDDEPEDIATSLQREIDKSALANNRKSLRFLHVDTGVSNCQFFRTTLPDPVAMAEHIVRDIAETHKQVSRFILRFIPIEVVCKTSIDDIINSAGRLFDKYFLAGPPVTFSIVFNRRYNNDIGRDKIYAELADLVKLKNVNHKVDLKRPQKTVIVEVIKGLCCMSVVSEYLQLRKYNLLELALKRDDVKPSHPVGNDEMKQQTNENETKSTECGEIASANECQSVDV